MKHLFSLIKSGFGGLKLAAPHRSFQIFGLLSAWALMLLYTAKGDRLEYIAVLFFSALVLFSDVLRHAAAASGNDNMLSLAESGVFICVVAAAAAGAFLFVSADMLSRILAGALERGWCGVMIVVLPISAVLLFFPPTKTQKDAPPAQTEPNGE